MWRQSTLFIISRSFLLRMRNVSEKVVQKFKTHILCKISFFFENLAVYEIMWKILSRRADHQWQYGACALYGGYLRLQTLSEYNSYCFFTATMVAQKRLKFTLYAHCLSVGSWDMTPSSYIGTSRYFVGIYCHDASTYGCSSSELFPWKTGVCRTTWHPFPQDSCCHSNQSENSKGTPPPIPQSCLYAYH